MPSKERACAQRWAGAAPRHEPPLVRAPAAAPRRGAGIRRQLGPAQKRR